MYRRLEPDGNRAEYRDLFYAYRSMSYEAKKKKKLNETNGQRQLPVTGNKCRALREVSQRCQRP